MVILYDQDVFKDGMDYIPYVKMIIGYKNVNMSIGEIYFYLSETAELFV